MRYKLHYSKLNDYSDIPCYVKESSLELNGFILAESDTGEEKVFVLGIGDDCFVSDSIISICQFISYKLPYTVMGEPVKSIVKEIIDSINQPLADFDIFLQEYSSYEEAYKVALAWKEDSELCYEKN
jgi:hypothetical protein